jgi:hypothetical protein
VIWRRASARRTFLGGRVFDRLPLVGSLLNVTASLPRVVWLLWLQGWGQAPLVARACLESWRRLNPGWEVRALDGSVLDQYLGSQAFARIAAVPKEPEAFADQIRIELLHLHGGVWADATTMCARPLDEWLPQRMGSGFFAFERPTPDRMLASWFLAAAVPCDIVAKWRASVAGYWTGRESRHDYFWFHGLFGALYDEDPSFRSTWDATLSLPARHAFHFAPEDSRLTSAATPDYVAALASPPSPVFKLTHKVSKDPEPNSLLQLLCDFGCGVAPA